MNKQEQKVKNAGQGSVAWVYDEEHGWINVNLFLKNIEKELFAKFQDMEYVT